jgi:hypothetical protein
MIAKHKNLLTQCYIEKCAEFNFPIEEHGISGYNDCDDVIEWIEQKDVTIKKFYIMSLTMDGFLIPLSIAKKLQTLENLPEDYYDENVNDILMYKSNPLCDIFRVEILNKLYKEDESILSLKWKLRRLEKYYTLGIDEYKKQYKI